MTSNFVGRGRRLSAQTQEAYELHGASPRTILDQLYYYHTFLCDVVPWGVTVHHIPASRPGYEYGENEREEIQLLEASGRIFMSGLISLERGANNIETVAGNEAYTQWFDGCFVPDDQNWRFFTGLQRIRFYSSQDGDSFDLTDAFDPHEEALLVAAFLQQEYDRLRYC